MDRLILVTGGTGYLGSALVPVLAQKWPVRAQGTMVYGNPLDGIPKVQFVQGDIRDARLLEEALEGATDVVHLAGIVTDELVAMNEGLSREVNLDATRNLCLAARERGVRRFIFASAGSVYGNQDGICTEESPLRPMSAYTRMKLEGELILNSLAEGPFAVCSLRIAGCCGPAPRMRLDTIVNVFSKQAYFDGAITVYGGGQWRSNVHVADVAELIAVLLEAPPDKIQRQAFNVAAQNAQALDIARIVQRVTAEFNRATGRPVPPPRIVVDASRQDQRHYRLDGSKLERVIGWRPRRTIEDAVVDNLRWFASGGVPDPDSDLYYNVRRMGRAMMGGGLAAWPSSLP